MATRGTALDGGFSTWPPHAAQAFTGRCVNALGHRHTDDQASHAVRQFYFNKKFYQGHKQT
jgi:hypothetical protein